MESLKCGNKLNKDGNFCSKCGIDLILWSLSPLISFIVMFVIYFIYWIWLESLSNFSDQVSGIGILFLLFLLFVYAFVCSIGCFILSIFCILKINKFKKSNLYFRIIIIFDYVITIIFAFPWFVYFLYILRLELGVFGLG